MRLVNRNFLFSGLFTLVVCVSLNSCGGARSLTEGTSASSAYSQGTAFSEGSDANSAQPGESGSTTSYASTPTPSSPLLDQPNSLFIKRLDVEIEDDDLEASFRSSIIMQRDEFIQISCSAPMGMELLRILLTQDSIKLLDLHDKWFSLSDYTTFFASSPSTPSFEEFQNFIIDLAEFSEENPGKPYILEFSQSPGSLSSSTTTELSSSQRAGSTDTATGLSSSQGAGSTDTPKKRSGADASDVKGSPLLSLIDILFPEHSGSLSVVLEIKKIEVNLEVKQNFRIPAKYREVYTLSDM